MKKIIFTLFIVITLTACDSTRPTNVIPVSSVFTSDDPTYGFVQNNPVKLGGFLRGTKSEGAHVQYFEGLRGPNGEHVSVERLGSCCPFEDESMPFGGGLLDRYQLTYKGIEEPIVIFVNLYVFEKPLAPIGFKLL